MTTTQTAEPMNSDLQAGVVRALATTLGRPLGDVDASTTLFGDLGLDSTSVLDLMLNLEDELGVEIETGDLDLHDFETVGTVVAFVAQLSRG